MTMYPQELGMIPAETARVARAAYPKGSLAMRLRDELGAIYRDEHFVGLFASRGQPAEAPWRLALVLVLQYVEGLTDRQAAEAVRGRIDWKYALGLDLTDPGLDASVLSEFRARIVAGGAEAQLLDVLLELCKHRGWRNRGREPTHRFDPCAGARAFAVEFGMCGGDLAGSPQCPGASGCGLAGPADQCRVARALWASGGELSLAQGRRVNAVPWPSRSEPMDWRCCRPWSKQARLPRCRAWRACRGFGRCGSNTLR